MLSILLHFLHRTIMFISLKLKKHLYIKIVLSDSQLLTRENKQLIFDQNRGFEIRKLNYNNLRIFGPYHDTNFLKNVVYKIIAQKCRPFLSINIYLNQSHHLSMNNSLSLQSYSRLLQASVKALKDFRPARQTPDSFINTFLQGGLTSLGSNPPKKYTLEESEQCFIREVFSGVLRYRSFLTTFVKPLSQNSPTLSSSKDTLILQIITYLVLFRLDELKLQVFQSLVAQIPRHKLATYLEYILQEKNSLLSKVFPAAAQYLDQQYVKDVLITRLEKNSQKLFHILRTASLEATGQVSKLLSELHLNKLECQQPECKKESKSVTVPHPFNLSMPKQLTIPEPIKINTVFKAKPVPKALGNLSLEDLQEQRRHRLQANKQELSSKYQKIINKLPNQPLCINSAPVKEDNQINTHSSLPRIKPFPKHIYTSTPQIIPNPTVNTILKEELLVKQIEEIDKQRIEQLEMGLRNTDEFRKYREKVKAEEAKQQIEKNLIKKLEIQIMKENVSQLQDNIKKQNKQKVLSFKNELEGYRKEYEDKIREDQEHIRSMKADVEESHRNAQKERIRIALENKQIRDTIVEEKREFKKIIIQKEMMELERKKKLIEEIRELDVKLKFLRQQQQLENQSPVKSLGLLEQMTLEDLKERLKQRKAQLKQEEQLKRSIILREKHKKDEELEEIKTRLKQHHSMMSLKRQEIREQEQRRKEQERRNMEQKLRRAEQQFNAKQYRISQEREKVKQELRRGQAESNMQKSYSGQNNIEFNKYKHIQLAQERNAQERQNNQLLKELGSLKVQQTRLKEMHKSVHISRGRD